MLGEERHDPISGVREIRIGGMELDLIRITVAVLLEAGPQDAGFAG